MKEHPGWITDTAVYLATFGSLASVSSLAKNICRGETNTRAREYVERGRPTDRDSAPSATRRSQIAAGSTGSRWPIRIQSSCNFDFATVQWQPDINGPKTTSNRSGARTILRAVSTVSRIHAASIGHEHHRTAPPNRPTPPTLHPSRRPKPSPCYRHNRRQRR